MVVRGPDRGEGLHSFAVMQWKAADTQPSHIIFHQNRFLT